MSAAEVPAESAFPTISTTAVTIAATMGTARQARLFGRLRFVREAEAGQRHARHAKAEFFQRLPARNGLGHALGQFIEFVVHSFPFRSSAVRFK